MFFVRWTLLLLVCLLVAIWFGHFAYRHNVRNTFLSIKISQMEIIIPNDSTLYWILLSFFLNLKSNIELNWDEIKTKNQAEWKQNNGNERINRFFVLYLTGNEFDSRPQIGDIIRDISRRKKLKRNKKSKKKLRQLSCNRDQAVLWIMWNTPGHTSYHVICINWSLPSMCMRVLSLAGWF